MGQKWGLLKRFRALKFWNKVGAVGALASVLGLAVALFKSEPQPDIEHTLTNDNSTHMHISGDFINRKFTVQDSFNSEVDESRESPSGASISKGYEAKTTTGTNAEEIDDGVLDAESLLSSFSKLTNLEDQRKFAGRYQGVRVRLRIHSFDVISAMKLDNGKDGHCLIIKGVTSKGILVRAHFDDSELTQDRFKEVGKSILVEGRFYKLEFEESKNEVEIGSITKFTIDACTSSMINERKE